MGILLEIVKDNALYEFRDEETCPVCGRTFIPAPEHRWEIGEHGFKTRNIRVCSYTCMRKWEKETEAKERNISRAKRQRKRELR